MSRLLLGHYTPTSVARSALVRAAILLPLLLVACGSGGQSAPGYDLAQGGRAQAAAGERNLPPIDLPRDEAPHRDLTEWWYYTGHLEAEGKEYGFELVTFQVVRGAIPVTYISHFAITDVGRGRFAYDQKQASGAQPQPEQGFRVGAGGWEMSGLGGRDRLRASMEGYSIDLVLTATKPPVLHDGDGILSLGPAGDTYYYSRTRMSVEGMLTDHGKRLPVTGQAWMDHQWGNFITVAGGGWDWYSAQLDDGSEVTVSVLRDAEGKEILTYGTYVGPDGTTEDLREEGFEVIPTAQWKSPRTGTTYPANWRLKVPRKQLDLRITPVLPDQELDTRRTTGVVYWEGAVRVTGTRAGNPVAGKGYVELTGYADQGSASISSP